MKRQATWMSLIITQITHFLIGTCLQVTLTGGETPVAAQEKEELQPNY